MSRSQIFTVARRLLLASVFALIAGPIGSALAHDLPLPMKTGEVFMLDDFDNKVTIGDLGENYFAGNAGVIQQVPGTAAISLSPESNETPGGSLQFEFDFSVQRRRELFVGVFNSVFGVTDTFVTLDGSGKRPAESIAFPGYFLNSRDLFQGFAPWRDRSVDLLNLDVRLVSDTPVIIKLELKDDAGRTVFARRKVANKSWHTLRFELPYGFVRGNTLHFDCDVYRCSPSWWNAYMRPMVFTTQTRASY